VNSANDITYVHAANASAAFEAFAWRFDNSSFDRYQRGDYYALSPSAKYGMRLFYRAAEWYRCHSGKFKTDHDFHAIAMPQIGPGKGDGYDGHEDHSRKRVTGQHRDKYRSAPRRAGKRSSLVF
jgi:cytochrome c peroxidase